MSQAGDALRSIYRNIDDGLYTERREEQDVPDEDMDMADQMAFAHWEVQLVSRAPQSYDFDSHDPALRRNVQEELRSQIAFFNNHNTTESQELDEFDECGYEESRQATIDSDTNRSSWWPSSTTGWRTVVDKLERFHKIFEEKKYLNGLAGPSEGFSRSFSRSRDGQRPADDYEMLYNVLGMSQSPETLDIYLSCPPGEPIQRHRTSIRIERPKRKRERPNQQIRHTRLDICHEIRTLYRANFRRLYLIFGDNGIKLGKDPRRDILPPPPGPQTIRLSDVLETDILETDDLRMTLKKSHLALDLALSVQHMYAGPWIQQPLNAHVIELLYEKEAVFYGDFTYACIPCELVQDWQATNSVWREAQKEVDLEKSSSSFFLSLAQLLVDISLGKKWKPPLDKDLRTSLIEEADRMKRNYFLKWYGEAVLASVHFTVDYKLSRLQSKSKDSTVVAREVIFDHIVKNLSTHLRFWEEQSGVQDILKADKVPHKEVSRFPNRMAGEIPTSYFTLFAPGDERHEKMNMTSDSQVEFQRLMKEFLHQFIVPASQGIYLADIKTVRPPAVVIAVLDTGLCIDDSDTLLWAGCDTRLRREFSRDYFNSKGGCSGWDKDIHGHGTHVVRILLQYTVSAEIIVLKVAESRKMAYTPKMLDQFLQALEWAGEHADIINLSVGLDEAAKSKMQRVIDDIILKKGKLIFAAASNSGGNGVRAYPAKERGVFAIHATKGNGTNPDEDMNPPAKSGLGADNFATLGCSIPSRWKGEDVLVSGTSFATPVAAAIAANALEFARVAPIKHPEYFSSYQGMRSMLHLMSSKVGNYDYIRPWTEGMFRKERSVPDMQEKLQQLSILHEN